MSLVSLLVFAGALIIAAGAGPQHRSACLARPGARGARRASLRARHVVRRVHLDLAGGVRAECDRAHLRSPVRCLEIRRHGVSPFLAWKRWFAPAGSQGRGWRCHGLARAYVPCRSRRDARQPEDHGLLHGTPAGARRPPRGHAAWMGGADGHRRLRAVPGRHHLDRAGLARTPIPRSRRAVRIVNRSSAAVMAGAAIAMAARG